MPSSNSLTSSSSSATSPMPTTAVTGCPLSSSHLLRMTVSCWQQTASEEVMTSGCPGWRVHWWQDPSWRWCTRWCWPSGCHLQDNCKHHSLWVCPFQAHPCSSAKEKEVSSCQQTFTVKKAKKAGVSPETGAKVPCSSWWVPHLRWSSSHQSPWSLKCCWCCGDCDQLGLRGWTLWLDYDTHSFWVRNTVWSTSHWDGNLTPRLSAHLDTWYYPQDLWSPAMARALGPSDPVWQCARRVCLLASSCPELMSHTLQSALIQDCHFLSHYPCPLSHSLLIKNSFDSTISTGWRKKAGVGD